MRYMLRISVIALAILAGACSRAEKDQRSADIPFDSDWILESYRAGMGSELGALGGLRIKPANDALELDYRLVPNDPDRMQLEVMHELDGTHKAFGRTSDLIGARITAVVKVPAELLPANEDSKTAGIQCFCESENKDGVRARQYGQWLDIPPANRKVTVSFEPTLLEEKGWRDPEFRPDRITECGLKVALNDRAHGEFKGTIRINEFRMDLPEAENHDQLKSKMRACIKHVSDQETLSRLPPLEKPNPKETTLSVGQALIAGSPSVTSIQTVPEPAGTRSLVWQIAIQFDRYEDSVAGRTARMTLPLAKPIDLRGRRITAWVAAGPSLRGGALRPNLVQIELEDEYGKFLRGPVSDLSALGMIFDKGVEHASQWVKVEAAPAPGRPLALGSIAPGFRAEKIRKIHLRFQTGKFSNALRDDEYPLSGKLLMSGFHTEPDGGQSGEVQTTNLAAPVSKSPVPIGQFAIGINLPFYHYGDIGAFPFGGREIGGFSSRPAKLNRHFALFAEHRIKVVRVFLLSDLRTGVTYDESGKVSDLDAYALRDLDALISAASANSISLCPVLIDFMIADQSRERIYGARKWNDGEAPQVLLDSRHRTAFIENALRPIVRRLAEADRRRPGVIFAVEIANEIENASAIRTKAEFEQVAVFVRQVRDMIRREAPNLKITLGSRDRLDLASYWRDISDIHQFHFYSKHEEEEGLPLRFPAGNLGLAGPVIVGEVEPDRIACRLDEIYESGYDGAFFWSHSGHDGFVVDLGQISRWVENKHR